MAASFDVSPLLEEYGDASLVIEITQMFVETCPSQVEAIIVAASGRDAAALRASAHRLRGALATFGARSATHLALTLETMANSGEMAGVDTLVAQLVTEVQELCDGASAWLAHANESTS